VGLANFQKHHGKCHFPQIWGKEFPLGPKKKNRQHKTKKSILDRTIAGWILRSMASKMGKTTQVLQAGEGENKNGRGEFKFHGSKQPHCRGNSLHPFRKRGKVSSSKCKRRGGVFNFASPSGGAAPVLRGSRPKSTKTWARGRQRPLPRLIFHVETWMCWENDGPFSWGGKL